MPGTQSWAVDQWLKAQLLNNSTRSTALQAALGGRKFYVDQVPEGTTLPVILAVNMGGVDVNNLGIARVMTEYSYQVKSITNPGGWQQGETLASMVDEIIQSAKGLVDDPPVEIMGCYRLTPIRYIATLEGGGRENHCGGLYRIYCCAR